MLPLLPFLLLLPSLSSPALAQLDPTPTLPSIVGLTAIPNPTPTPSLLKFQNEKRGCAASYSAKTMIKGTGTLPKPTAFVTRKNQNLLLSGKNFRIAGTNIYWLCNDENVAPVGYYTDKGRIREALAIAVAMGSNTIRIMTCSTSVGFKYAIEPSRADFEAANSAQWDIRDYVIYAAGQYGLRVIMTLTDDYDFYYGSKYTFLDWRGVSTKNNGALFYTDTATINDYRTYILQLIQHKNPYTGKTYSQDPTILAWETGNELGAYIGKEGYPPASWTNNIAGFIKSYDKNHLVIDGSDGFYNYSTKATAPGLGVAAIDIITDHSYPRNIALLQAEVPLATKANKAFLIGEFDWTNNFGGNNLTTYLSYLESNTYFGSLVWSIQGHDAQCCNFVTHNDGYSIYYPNGNSGTQQNLIMQVVQHFYRITGRTVPTQLPGVVCPQPVF